MSLAVLKKEIERFIGTTKPEVLCLRGGWGVGKTYLWNICLAEIESETHSGLSAYSYVSLFGLNHLSDLRMSVYQERRRIAEDENRERWVSLLKGKLDLRKRTGLIRAIPHIGKLSDEDVMGLLSIAETPHQIVCIDDVERRGDQLSVKDILGFASYLKEERKCKVIIILNDEELDPTGREQMNTHLEKVVDVSLTMKPTSREAVSVAITGLDDLSRSVASKCLALGISNIRAIRRAKALSESVQLFLDGCEDKTKDNVVSSVVLFSWSRDQPNEAPTTQFLLSLNSIGKLFPLGREDDQQDPEATKWMPLLDAYNYGWTDDLDIALMEGVAAGYFEVDKLGPLIEKFDAGVKAEIADATFSDAWRLYHDSFEDNETEVADALFNSFKQNFAYITPVNALGTFRLLKDLGREEQARKLVDIYVSGRKEGRGFFDLDRNDFIEGDIDPYFRAAFDKKRNELTELLDFKESLLSIEAGWSPERLDFLADASVEEYFAAFKESEGKELRTLVSNAMSFRRIANPSESMTKITEKSHSALERIGKESRLNARRVGKYGIKSVPEV